MAGSAWTGHSGDRSASMAEMRTRHIPHRVQARVALATAFTVAAPSSMAVLTSSVVTARQMHAYTTSPLLPGRVWSVWLGYPN
jgi:hypothetical protein